MGKAAARPLRNTYALETIWEVLCERLGQILPDSAMTGWVEHFQLVSLTRRRVVILYIGNGDLSVFRREYYDQFAGCLFELVGHEADVTFKQKRTTARKKHVVVRKIGLLALICAAALAAVVGVSFLKDRTFRETFYQVGSGKLDGDLRILHLSDLHGTAFGDDNRELVRRAGLLEPDLIVMTGDMADQDDQSDEVLLSLCRRLTDIAPVYYIYGNNECSKSYGIPMGLASIDQFLGCTEEDRDAGKFLDLEDPLRAQLEEAGVHVLLNEMEQAELNGNTVDIYGVLTSNPSAFWPYAEETYGGFRNEDQQNFKLLLCHEPLIFHTFEDPDWGDLILCGDTHGGVIRLPYLGGLYTRNGGLLPELRHTDYVYGAYENEGSPLIVSSGLTNRGMIRINNQPEMVVVDVNRY